MPDSGQHKNKKARSFVVEERRNPSGEGVIDPGMHELGKAVLSMPWKK